MYITWSNQLQMLKWQTKEDKKHVAVTPKHASDVQLKLYETIQMQMPLLTSICPWISMAIERAIGYCVNISEGIKVAG